MAEFDRVIIFWPRKLGKCDCYKFLLGKSQITHLAQPNVTNIQSQKLKPFQAPPLEQYLASHAQCRIQGHLWGKWAKKTFKITNFGRTKKRRRWRCPWILVFFVLESSRVNLLSQLWTWNVAQWEGCLMMVRKVLVISLTKHCLAIASVSRAPGGYHLKAVIVFHKCHLDINMLVVCRAVLYGFNEWCHFYMPRVLFCVRSCFPLVVEIYADNPWNCVSVRRCVLQFRHLCVKTEIRVDLVTWYLRSLFSFQSLSPGSVRRVSFWW